MATYAGVLPTFAIAQTADLRAVMASINTLMLNAGFVRSSDTGQADPSTATWATASGTVFGYFVYYLNDSLHATHPIYVRLYFKNQASSLLAIYLTVGHATDGAGNITGYKNATQDSLVIWGSSSGTWGTAGNNSYASAGEGYAFWSLCTNTGTTLSPFFLLTREWDDSTGAPKSNSNYSYLYPSTNTTSGAPYQTCVNSAKSFVIGQGSNFCYVPGYVTQSQTPANTDIFRHVQQFPSFTMSGASCTYHPTEISAGSTFSARVLTGGSDRTWLATGIVKAATLSSYSSVTSHGLAVIWE